MTFTVVFSEAMNQQPAVTPVISFPEMTPAVAQTLSFASGIWLTSSALSDGMQDITVRFSDPAGNGRTGPAPAVEIDAARPTVTASLSDPLINDADEGGMATVTLTLTFNEDMDQSIAPTVAVVPAGVLTNPTGV